MRILTIILLLSFLSIINPLGINPLGINLPGINLVGAGQTIRNPKLSGADLAAAQGVTEEEAGSAGELVYATRLDAITRGSYDSLIVIYARAEGAGKNYYALVVQDGRKYRLARDGSGRALAAGDRFLRMGLRHEEGKSPILRLMAATQPGEGSEGRQRNLDFRFDGTEFKMIGESVTSLAR